MFAWNLGWYWGEIEMTYCDADILQCSVTGEKEPECDSSYWGETEIPTSSPGNSSHNHHHHHPHHDHHHPPDHPPLPPLQQPGADWLLQVHRQAHDVSVPGLSVGWWWWWDTRKYWDHFLEIKPGGFNTFITQVWCHLNVVKSINSDIFPIF